MNLLSFLCPEGAVTDHSHMQELFVWWGFLFSTWNLSAADARKVCAFMSLTGWFLHTSFRTTLCFAGVLPKWADPGKSSLCQLGFSQRHSYWLVHTWVKHRTENGLDFFDFSDLGLRVGQHNKLSCLRDIVIYTCFFFWCVFTRLQPGLNIFTCIYNYA